MISFPGLVRGLDLKTTLWPKARIKKRATATLKHTRRVYLEMVGQTRLWLTNRATAAQLLHWRHPQQRYHYEEWGPLFVVWLTAGVSRQHGMKVDPERRRARKERELFSTNNLFAQPLSLSSSLCRLKLVCEGGERGRKGVLNAQRRCHGGN